MPSSSSIDTRTFKQRKSFGKLLYKIGLKYNKPSFFILIATRKEEVAGIRNKFPNSK